MAEEVIQEEAVEIEEAVSHLAMQDFDAAEFPFAFLKAFDNKETTETNDKTANINLVIETPTTDNTSNDVNKTTEMKPNISKVENTVLETKPKKQELTQSDMDKAIKTLTPSSIKFNDNDSVLDLGTNKSSEVNAPKTIERLEKISHDLLMLD